MGVDHAQARVVGDRAGIADREHGRARGGAAVVGEHVPEPHVRAGERVTVGAPFAQELDPAPTAVGAGHAHDEARNDLLQLFE